MDKILLIPETETHDLKGVVRQSLQGFCKQAIYRTEHNEYHEHYFDKDFVSLKRCSLDLAKTVYKTEEKVKELNDVEEQLMTFKGEYLVKKEETKDDIIFLESKKLKRYEVLREVDKVTRDQYFLISKEDLLKTRIEQAIDPLYNTNLHTCRDKSKCIQQITYGTSKKVSNDSSQYAIDLYDERQIKKVIEVNEKTLHKKHPVKKIFIAEPEILTIYNYDLNTSYKMSLKLRNISHTSQKIGRCILSSTSFFSIEGNNEGKKVAPGMSLEFQVNFRAPYFIDSNDVAVFRVGRNEEDVIIALKSLRDYPSLRCYMFRSDTCFLHNVMPWESKYRCDRQAALNYTLDCGSCLLGETAFITLAILCEKQNAKFFLITENEWFIATVQDVSESLLLTTSVFKIFPAYFIAAIDEYVQVLLSFAPREPGLQMEYLYLICDNNAFQTLSIIGDGMLLEKDIFKITVRQVKDPDVVKLAEGISTVSIFLGYLEAPETFHLIFTIQNTSALSMKFFWLITQQERSNENLKNKPVIPIKLEWIKFDSKDELIHPYCTSDFKLKITMDGDKSIGYYNISFGFYIQNVPIECLKEDQEYVLLNPDENSKRVDVCIADIALVCLCDFKIKEPTPQQEIPENIAKVQENYDHYHHMLKFSKNILEFGKIPKGVVLHQALQVENLLDEKVKWRIIEIELTTDIAIIPNHLTKMSGIIAKKSKTSTCYQVISLEEKQHCSMLILLIQTPSAKEIAVGSVCLVSYQTIPFEVHLHTINSTLPLLCPQKLLHVGVISRHNIFVHNSSIDLLAGFYFFQPTGDDLHNVLIKISPQSGIVNKSSCQQVELEITPLRCGIFHRIYIPCFIGDMERIVMLRVMCAADDIKVCFKIPKIDGGFGLSSMDWPPNAEIESSYSDYDYYCTCQEYTMVGEDFNHAPPKLEATSDVENEYLIGEGDFISLSPGISIKQDTIIQSTLKKHFGEELILQECIVEMPNIPIRTPRKISFFCENLTPVTSTMTVESVNYGNYECNVSHPLQRVLVKNKLKSEIKLWEENCDENYGILVHPMIENSRIESYSVNEITVWVYANTWGIYMEEIVVEIKDIMPFTFSLLIEVVGNPIEFPFALNTIRDDPILRFGCVRYNSELKKREVRITNCSSVPVFIMWHVFETKGEERSSCSFETDSAFNCIFDSLSMDDEQTVNLFCSKKYYGEENSSTFQIAPPQFWLDAKSSSTIDVCLMRKTAYGNLSSKNVTARVVGFIYLQKQFKSKTNYFYRDTIADIDPVRLDLTVSYHAPILNLHLVNIEDAIISEYVNRVIFRKVASLETTLRLRNDSCAPMRISFSVSEPFIIDSWETSRASDGMFYTHVTVPEKEYIKITIKFPSSHSLMLVYSQYVYGVVCDHNEAVDQEKKILEIIRDLIVMQNGLLYQTIPIKIILHFPNMTVKPTFIKFRYTRIGQTRKTYLEIRNHTAYVIKFEVYKSCTNYDITVKPHYDAIKATTAQNTSFKQIAVYFTPQHCKHYQESLRIQTNIPHYYIDIPMSGYGVNNEKFDQFQNV